MLVALVAALAGFLVRGWISSPAPVPAAPVVTVLACPEPQPAAVAAPRASRPVKPAATSTTPLPALAPVDEARDALLAFVKERSSELAACAGARRERLRLTVRLEVTEAGVIEKVAVLEDEPSLTAVRTCVQQGMVTWTLPAEWLQGQRTLLVSVVL